MPHPPPDLNAWDIVDSHIPMNFTIAAFTPAENDELRAMCYVAGVRLRTLQTPHRHSEDFMVIGPHGRRRYMLRDLQPLTMDVMRAVIRHGTEVQS